MSELPPGPALALRQALLAHLGADAALATMMGGTLRLTDEPARGASGVYATFGPMRMTGRAADGVALVRHELELAVWSRPGGMKPALEAAERIAALLDGAALPLAPHRLLVLSANVEAARDVRSGLGRAIVRLAALVETQPG